MTLLSQPASTLSFVLTDHPCDRRTGSCGNPWVGCRLATTFVCNGKRRKRKFIPSQISFPAHNESPPLYFRYITIYYGYLLFYLRALMTACRISPNKLFRILCTQYNIPRRTARVIASHGEWLSDRMGAKMVRSIIEAEFALEPARADNRTAALGTRLGCASINSYRRAMA